MELFNANVGDKVGVITMPGQSPSDFTGVVTAKVEDKWGKNLVIKLQDGSADTCHSFRTFGNGWYYLGA